METQNQIPKNRIVARRLVARYNRRLIEWIFESEERGVGVASLVICGRRAYTPQGNSDVNPEIACPLDTALE